MQAFHASVMEVRYFGDLLRRAAVSAYRDNCFGIAKGAAYSALLSFFPVLTTLTALLVQANAYAVSRSISRVVYEVVPPGTEEIVMQIFTRRGRQPGYLLVIARDLAHAAELSRGCPIFEYGGTVEVRPTRPMTP